MKSMLYTIGHSNHEIASFIRLLHQHGITAISDVRSHPYSRYAPQYTREPLKAALMDAGIAYVFLGRELGARSENPACYKNGKVQYDRLAQEPSFLEGIKRISQGTDRHRIALMCAEKDPIECHRALLVSRKLFEAGIQVNHILADGTIETHMALESRLLTLCKFHERDMFKSQEEFLDEAYSMQGNRVSYKDQGMAEAERPIAS